MLTRVFFATAPLHLPETGPWRFVTSSVLVGRRRHRRPPTGAEAKAQGHDAENEIDHAVGGVMPGEREAVITRQTTPALISVMRAILSADVFLSFFRDVRMGGYARRWCMRRRSKAEMTGATTARMCRPREPGRWARATPVRAPSAAMARASQGLSCSDEGIIVRFARQ